MSKQRDARPVSERRAEHELDRDRGFDEDVRMMRKTVFWLLVGLFVGSAVGTFAGWEGASHVLAVLVSGVVGTLIQNPFRELFRSPHG